MTKKQITLKPGAQHDPASGCFFPTITTYCDGALCAYVVGPDTFAAAPLARAFAETQALGSVDEMLRHYGDCYTFVVTVAEVARAFLDAYAEAPLPGFLLREYRARNPRAFH